MAAWPYDTAQWRRLRRLKLQVAPLCEWCERAGRVEPATVVDHVFAISNGGDPFPGLDGLMSMCVRCHNAKTRNVEQLGNQHLVKGSDATGLPVDANHPFLTGIPPLRTASSPPNGRRPNRAHNSFGRR